MIGTPGVLIFSFFSHPYLPFFQLNTNSHET